MDWPELSDWGQGGSRVMTMKGKWCQRKYWKGIQEGETQLEGPEEDG